MSHSKTVLQKSTRAIVLDAFTLLLSGKAKKRIRIGLDDILSESFGKYQLSLQDRRFTTHLAYTLCRYWFALDTTLATLSQFPLNKIQPKALLLLKMGLIQLSPYIEVPQHAAVYETVELAKHIKLNKKTQGFINALLQRVAREPGLLKLEKQNVLPPWLNDYLTQHYDSHWISQYQDIFLTPPQGLSIRHNPLKVTRENLLKHFDAANIPYETEELPEGIQEPLILERIYLPTQTQASEVPGYSEGFFSPQDKSAMRVALMAEPKAGEHILEIGAAPGGKTAHLAALLKNTGRITAVDIRQNRLDMMMDYLARLGVTNVQSVCYDFISQETLRPEALLAQYDKIVIDAPCTATGIVRKHPDIILQAQPKEFKQKQAIQLSLLQNTWPLLRLSGKLIYATCSIALDENENVISAFLKDNASTAHLVSQETYPMTADQDGFFIAVLKKQ